MQHKRRRSNNAVRAFLLHAWHACQEFIGYIFAQAHFAKLRACNFQALCFHNLFAVVVKRMHIKHGGFFIVNFAEIVFHPFNQLPLTVRRHHFPVSQIIECCAPQNRLFTACVHGNIAADTRRIRRSRINRKHKPSLICRFFHTASNRTHTTTHQRIFAV